MQTLKLIGSLVLLLLTFNSSTAQNDQSPKAIEVSDNEQCFAKCLMGDQYEEQTTEYYVFTGNAEEEEVELETVVLEVAPPKTEWIKKKADKNCLSKDPDDCLVWCLVEVPAETEEFKVLKDKTKSDNYTVKSYTATVLVRKGGYTEEKEVLCEHKITPEIIKQVRSALKKRGYPSGVKSKKINPRLKSALTKYQQANKLPVGQLDLETLEKLNIEF